jgi:replication fork clamp-binding protein CrfC
MYIMDLEWQDSNWPFISFQKNYLKVSECYNLTVIASFLPNLALLLEEVFGLILNQVISHLHNMLL